MSQTQTKDHEAQASNKPESQEPPSGAAPKGREDGKVELRFKAAGPRQNYHGFDGPVQVKAEKDGDIVVVSPAKAKALLADSPENFSEVEAGSAERAQKAAEAAEAKRAAAAAKDAAEKEAQAKKDRKGEKPRAGGKK